MKIGFICFLIVFMSCNSAKKEQEAISVDDFSELTKVDEASDDSRLNGDMIIFCKTNESNLIGYSNIYKFVNLFKTQPKYKNETFNEFVLNIIDFKKDFDCGDIIKCFSLNDTIVSIYEQGNIEALCKGYTERYNDKYQIKNNISSNLQLSIIYFLYKKHYYTALDDYSGYYYSRKIDDFADQLININLEEWK